MAKTTPLSKEDDRLIKRCLPWLRKEQRKKLLPTDIAHLKLLEKGRPGAYEDFLKLIEIAATTPVSKLKSAQAVPKRSGQAQHLI